MDDDSTLWNEFLNGASWSELFWQYADAVNELMAYCRACPDAKQADERVVAAMQGVTTLRPTMVRYAGDKTALQSAPPVTLSRAVMEAIGHVRRALPQPTKH